MADVEAEDTRSPEAGSESLIERATHALRDALHVAEASLALLRAELSLARSSALTLVWLGFAFVFFGVGAWLATSLAIALGIHALTGSFLIGTGVVALANLIGAAWVLRSMHRCWHDLSLPRTRALLVSTRPAVTTGLSTDTQSAESP